MSIKEDIKGTNAFYWDHKEREKYLSTISGEPLVTLDATVESCPYRFVCECETSLLFERHLLETKWLEKKSFAEERAERLKLELDERQTLEHKFWHWLEGIDPAMADQFAERVLVSDL